MANSSLTINRLISTLFVFSKSLPVTGNQYMSYASNLFYIALFKMNLLIELLKIS